MPEINTDFWFGNFKHIKLKVSTTLLLGMIYFNEFMRYKKLKNFFFQDVTSEK